ncbi:hypothetical protein H4R33_005483, partial [Dimargaris cristalligena]
SLEIISNEGKAGFYQGEIAQAIVDAVTAHGGLLTTEDLANHTSIPVKPIRAQYQGVEVFECPPNGQGLTVLMALKYLEEFERTGKIRPFSAMVPGSAEHYHPLIEALRLSFVDTRWYVCDPASRLPPALPAEETLLDQAYLTRRARLFDPHRRMTDLRHGGPGDADGAGAGGVVPASDGRPLPGCDTVYFAVVDGRGNACSFVMSIYSNFGTCIIPEIRGSCSPLTNSNSSSATVGFALHNRGCGFSLDPTSLNALGPAKRPYHTIIPGLVTTPTQAPVEGRGRTLPSADEPVVSVAGDPATMDDGELLYCFGVMGKFMQPQGHVQTLVHMLGFGHDPQTALDGPRFRLNLDEDTVSIEETPATATVVADLERLGHKVEVVRGIGRHDMGRGQIISRTHDEESQRFVLTGASEPRADGQAVGW